MEGWANLAEVNARGFKCRLDAGKNHTLSYTDQAEELFMVCQSSFDLNRSCVKSSA